MSDDGPRPAGSARDRPETRDPTGDRQPAVDLYVRADAPVTERRDAIVDRLRRLERTSRISRFTIHPWPKAVSLGLLERIDGGEILDLVRSFERWAEPRGLRVQPPFDVRVSRSTITGETDELLVLPVLCLAAYGDTDGELVGLSPCSDGESVYTIDDALDALATGDAPVPAFSSGGDSPVPERERRMLSGVLETTDPDATARDE